MIYDKFYFLVEVLIFYENKMNEQYKKDEKLIFTFQELGQDYRSQ